MRNRPRSKGEKKVGVETKESNHNNFFWNHCNNKRKTKERQKTGTKQRRIMQKFDFDFDSIQFDNILIFISDCIAVKNNHFPLIKKISHIFKKETLLNSSTNNVTIIKQSNNDEFVATRLHASPSS